MPPLFAAREALAFLYHQVLDLPLADIPLPQPPRSLHTCAITLAPLACGAVASPRIYSICVIAATVAVASVHFVFGRAVADERLVGFVVELGIVRAAREGAVEVAIFGAIFGRARTPAAEKDR